MASQRGCYSTAMKTAPAPDDMYDFSGVASDLAILRSQLLTLQIGHGGQKRSTLLSAMMDTSKTIKEADEDEEEWYPPSPPVYDVAEKLLEVNRDLQNDPTSTTHLPGKLRWRPEDDLVQIKWLYGNDCDQSGFISDGTDDDTVSSDECGGSRSCSGGLASQLAQELSFRLSMNSSLFPPKMNLPTIEDASPVPEQIVSHYEYEDEDFEEPSIAEEVARSPPEVVTQMETLNNAADNELSAEESEESESCRTVTAAIKAKKTEQQPIIVEANNNVHQHSEERPSRPRTKTTVIRTHSGVDDQVTTSLRSSSLPNANRNSDQQAYNNNHHNREIVSNSKPPIRGGGGSSSRKSTSKASSHATIKVTHSSNNNLSSSCSSSEEGNTSSSSNPSSLRFRSSSLQPIPAKSRLLMDSSKKPPSARNVIMAPTRESRPKTNKTSVYLNGNSGSTSTANRPRLLQRKISRNSLSSNSSVSSQTTEDSLATLGTTSSSNSVNVMRRSSAGQRLINHHVHPSVVADVISPCEADSPYFTQWKLRKREEKKLRQRRSFLEQQMRRH